MWLQDAPGIPASWAQQSCCTAGGKAECFHVFSLSPGPLELLPVTATEVLLISPVSDLRVLLSSEPLHLEFEKHQFGLFLS